MRSPLKARLDRIARGGDLPKAPAAEILYRRALPCPSPPAPEPAGPGPDSGPGAFERLVPGREVPAPTGGGAWLCEEVIPAPPGAERVREDVLFLDIETTGLGSFPLFLAGVLSRRGPVLRARQYLARTYAEEGAAISLFLADAGGSAGIASYNGKCFDLPYLRARAAACGVPFDLDHRHRDLLPECRRAYGGALPDCRLATLEARVLNHPRSGDLPGSEIPAVYHHFVRTGDARGLTRVLRHNREDLLALFSLAALLPDGPRSSVRPSDTCPAPLSR